ncbi:uncharacterized protein DNG_08790 [Cephalotrichum gorgonifer]|uniref:Uncharacterized protein n=1 Tax=Cephalotrichum gorgonifer TaxID=2041049 RepID=A0AAE8N485_9PEZI|nr:uncharacterized protein DNG_08790 [Cephalotrichum gorgonifer]
MANFQSNTLPMHLKVGNSNDAFVPVNPCDVSDIRETQRKILYAIAKTRVQASEAKLTPRGPVSASKGLVAPAKKKRKKSEKKKKKDNSRKGRYRGKDRENKFILRKDIPYNQFFKELRPRAGFRYNDVADIPRESGEAIRDRIGERSDGGKITITELDGRLVAGTRYTHGQRLPRLLLAIDRLYFAVTAWNVASDLSRLMSGLPVRPFKLEDRLKYEWDTDSSGFTDEAELEAEQRERDEDAAEAEEIFRHAVENPEDRIESSGYDDPQLVSYQTWAFYARHPEEVPEDYVAGEGMVARDPELEGYPRLL